MQEAAYSVIAHHFASQVPMSLLFQEQLFQFYARVPQSSLPSLQASRSVFFFVKL